MSRQSVTIVALCLVLASVATATEIRQQAAVTPLVAQPLPAAPADRGGCAVGNAADPYWNFGNWIMGGEVYAYLIRPGAEGCGCAEGFTLDRVSMLMQFGSEDTPVTFDAFAGLAEAVWNPASGRYVPGQEYCRSVTWSISAGLAGLYEIFVDLDGACPCATTGDAYFVTFHLPNDFTWWPDALEDNDPQPGVCYYDSGNGWQDLVGDFGWWGKNIMRAHVSCCAGPVPTEGRTWGQVKSTYR